MALVSVRFGIKKPARLAGRVWLGYISRSIGSFSFGLGFGFEPPGDGVGDAGLAGLSVPLILFASV